MSQIQVDSGLQGPDALCELAPTQMAESVLADIPDCSASVIEQRLPICCQGLLYCARIHCG